MGAAFNDEPNYFLRGVLLIALGLGIFFGLTWVQSAGIEALDSSFVAKAFFRLHLPYFLGAIFTLLGLVSWIRGLMSVAAHLNSCFLTASLAFLVLITITGAILFIEYRPDLAAKRVAERRVAQETGMPPETEPAVRTFTSADGRTMNAVLVGFDGRKVKIKRADGKVFTNRIELYSAADQAFIREQSKRATASERSPNQPESVPERP